MPLQFHTFPTTPPRARQEAPNVRRAAMFTGALGVPDALIHIIAEMMGRVCSSAVAPPPLLPSTDIERSWTADERTVPKIKSQEAVRIPRNADPNALPDLAGPDFAGFAVTASEP